uniref:Ribonuclease H-like domain-containing protein n=1 Tax=Tanacetum cinerariifolium TaxID=118510 RepID=A0A6L2LVC9_TANCI|nr:ribonuclease H-like domain-containing protein [Tanacetum cinerariifolium]
MFGQQPLAVWSIAADYLVSDRYPGVQSVCNIGPWPNVRTVYRPVKVSGERQIKEVILSNQLWYLQESIDIFRLLAIQFVIIHMISGIIDYGLHLFFSSTIDLVAYSDADWAGCSTTRRLTSGYCVFSGNNLLSWSAKHQLTLSRFSAEAEYRGVANAVVETCWLRNLLRELHTPLFSATLVYCDNVSAVYLSSNPIQHQRTKHIEIDIPFVHDLVATCQVRVLHVPSRYQFADIFIKGLPTALFEEFRSSLSVRCPPAQLRESVSHSICDYSYD